MNRTDRFPILSLAIASLLVLLSASPVLAQLDNPDPPSDTVTEFKVTQGVVAGSGMDPVRKLPHRDSYLVTPDRTGQIKLNVAVSHTFAGSISTRLVDNHGTVLHTFAGGSGTFNINCIQFFPPFHLLVLNPSGQAVESHTLVTPGVLRGPDGPDFVGTSDNSDYGIRIPPYMDEGYSVTTRGGEGDNGEDGSGSSSCGACSSCDQSTGNETEGANADPDTDDPVEVPVATDAQADDGSFDAAQPAGVSANGNSQTQLDALVDPGTGIRHNDIRVHGNGDATVTRNVDNEITAVETSNCYSKVEEVTTAHGLAIKISQWKLKSQADASAAPYRTILYENIATNQMRRTNTYSGHDVVTEWRYTPSPQKKWEVVSGNGLRRQETIREDDGTDPAKLVMRRKQYERAEGASGEAAVLVSDIRQTYTLQAFGWEKTKLEVFGMDNGPLVSVWEYWQPGESADGQGLLKRYGAPDGRESYYSYEEDAGVHTMTANSSPLNGDPLLSEQTVNTSTPTGSAMTQTERVGNSDFKSYAEVTWSGTGGNTFLFSSFSNSGGMTTTSGQVVPFGNDHGGQVTQSAPSSSYGETVTRVRNTTAGTLTITHKKGAMSGGTVVAGTATEVIIDRYGVPISRLSYDIGTNILYEYAQVTTTDSLLRPTVIDYTFDSASGPAWSEQIGYNCCGVSSFTDRDGIVTNYTYDDLHRRITEENRGITHQTVYDGLVVRTRRKAASGTGFTSYVEVSNHERNVGGTISISRSRSPQDGTLIASSTITEKYRNPESTSPNPYSLPASIGRRVETVLPLVADDNSVTPAEYTDYFFDGRPYETRGNLGTNLRYTYSMDDLGGTKYFTTRTQRMDGTTGRETSLRRVDWAGKVIRASGFGTGITQYYYNADDLLVRIVDGDGVTWLYGYNNLRERTIEALDLDLDGVIDYGSDQVTFRETKPVNNGTADVLRTTTKVWKPGAAFGSPTIVSYSETTADGLRSWKRSFPTTGSGYGVSFSQRTLGSTANPGDYTVTTTAKDGTISRSYYDTGYLGAETSWAAGSTPDAAMPSNIMSVSTTGFIAGTGYGYDVLGRRTAATDSRTGTVTTVYGEAAPATRDEVTGVIDAGGRGTSFTYDHRGRRKTVDAPDTPNPAGGNFANITTTTHYHDGSVKEIDGGQTYRTAYTYDYAERMKTLVTYGTTTATTTWNYDASGRLESKDDHTGKGPSYTYTLAGRLKKRIWQRGNTTRYDYDNGGRLSARRYFTAATSQTSVDSASAGNDSDTLDVIYTRDSLNRTTLVERGSTGTDHFTYTYNDDTLGLDTEFQNDAFFLPRLLTRKRDAILRPTGYLLGTIADPDAVSEITHAYDTAGRLSTVTFQRVPGAGSPPTAQTFTYGYNYTASLGGSYHVSKISGGSPSYLPFRVTGPQHVVTRSYEQTRNALHEIRNETAGSSLLSGYTYTVNDLGQRSAVTQAGSGFGVISGDGPDSFGWSYDLKGQIVAAASAVGSADDRFYAYDGIGNRTQSRVGTATSTGGTATDYYADSAATTAGANPLNQYVKVVSGISTAAPTYDDDGNMTSDGLVWNFAWDGENRLISATPIVPASGLQRMTYYYDYLGRMCRRSHASWSASAWNEFENVRYVYDGWNRIDSLNWDNSIGSQYVWGLDLSGSLQGAGGVGGMLLWANTTNNGNSWAVYHPTFDGNGNVSDLIDSSGTVAEHWEYDAFGNTTQSTNSLAWNDPGNLFEFRFSTKPQDPQTGLYYYGYRFYDPLTGRWPSRDPIEEKGGINLYGFILNSPPNFYDPDGRMLGCCVAIVRHHLERAEEYANEYAPDKTEHKEEGGTAKSQAGFGRDADALLHCIAGCSLARIPAPFLCTQRGLYETLQGREFDGTTPLSDNGSRMDRKNNHAGFQKGLDMGPGGLFENSTKACALECVSMLLNGELTELAPGEANGAGSPISDLVPSSFDPNNIFPVDQ